jgi:hypothetical protein
MKLRSFIAAAALTLAATTALAQTAPTSTAAPPPGWGPAAPPAQTAPYPTPPPGYPQPVYPPGAYPTPPPGWGPPAPQGTDPTVMGPDGRPRSLPLEMPYDPDKGVPPGYRIGEKRRIPLAIAGGVTFGAIWVASCIAGGIMLDNDEDGAPMYVPVLGPVITIGTARTSPAGTTALVFDAVAQAAGVAMFIAGMATSQQVLKYQFGPSEVSFTPFAAPTESGAVGGFTGTF